MRVIPLCEAIDYVKMKWYHLPKVPVFVCVTTGIATEKLHINFLHREPRSHKKGPQALGGYGR